MSRFALPLLAFAVLAALLAVGVQRSNTKSIIASPLIGRPAPEFALPSLTDPNSKVQSSQLRGQWYLLNVWGTWCAGCRDEHDVLLRIQREARVSIIGLNWKDDAAAALQWLAELGNPYQAVAVDQEGKVAIDWGVYGAPETYLVNPAGTVVHKHVGPLTVDIWQRKFLPLLP